MNSLPFMPHPMPRTVLAPIGYGTPWKKESPRFLISFFIFSPINPLISRDFSIVIFASGPLHYHKRFCYLFNCKSHFFTYRNILFAHKILSLLFNVRSILFYPQYTRSFFVFNNVFAFSIFILAIASRLLAPPTYIGVHISKIRS